MSVNDRERTLQLKDAQLAYSFCVYYWHLRK